MRIEEVIAVEIDTRCVYNNTLECPILKRLFRVVESAPEDLGGIAKLDLFLKAYSVLSSFCRSCKLVTIQAPRFQTRPPERAKPEVARPTQVSVARGLDETIGEIEVKYGDYVDVRDVGDKVYIVPIKRLGSLWREVNNIIKSIGGKWVRMENPMDSYWVIERGA